MTVKTRRSSSNGNAPATATPSILPSKKRKSGKDKSGETTPTNAPGIKSTIKTNSRMSAVVLKATGNIEVGNNEAGGAKYAKDNAAVDADRAKKHKGQALPAMINLAHELMGAQNDQKDSKKEKGNKS
eukprot:10041081-Ditylum_brightwellii.AAC.1